MKHSFLHFAFLVLLFMEISACKKPSVDPIATLTSHTWYPYQTYVIATDSITITETNATTGSNTVRKYNSKWDTTFLNSSCQQQSNFRFQQGGTYLISNKCSASSTDFTAQWMTLQPDIIRTYIPLSGYPPSADYPYFGFGDIRNTEVNESSFRFTNYAHRQISMSNSSRTYDSLLIQDTITYLTCRSR